ncbi:MAG: DHA2 family efflux MFS transporter permease subunit [Chloroflexi bacterium]|nr:DHA2 family efflux MFS transporter permease subunit [Chloroflexota bacterium]
MDHQRKEANPWLVLSVLCTGFFMILLDTTIVNIAIPSISDSLHAPLDEILWVLNGYILVYAVLLITAGRLGDIYGPRRLFILGMVVFLVASALCGLAQSTTQLIAARVVQGTGGALLTPQTLAILTTIFPPQRRGAAFGVWGAVAGIATIAGPTLGGFLVTNFSWRWVFYVNLPIGIVSLAATFVVMPDIRPGRGHRLDLVGVVLASLGLCCVLFGLIEGQRFNWGVVSDWLTIPGAMIAGVVLLALFGIWERFQAEPLLPGALFQNRDFVLMNWISAAISFAMLGLFFPITIYLQSALGLSAFVAGLTLAPSSLVSMFAAPLAGRMADRYGGKYILMGGLLVFATGMSLVALLATPTAASLTFVTPMALAGLGMGFVFAPLATVAMRDIAPRIAGSASGALNTTRQLGGVLGSAVVGAVLQTRLASTLHEHASDAAVQLPPDLRQRFVEAFDHAAGGGLDVGSSLAIGAALSSGLPPDLAAQVQSLLHSVFATGYVDALRPTLAVPIVVLVIGTVCCLAIGRGGRPNQAPRREPAGHPVTSQPVELS